MDISVNMKEGQDDDKDGVNLKEGQDDDKDGVNMKEGQDDDKDGMNMKEGQDDDKDDNDVDDNDDNASEEGYIMESLFTCEEYQLHTWKFPIVRNNIQPPSSIPTSSSLELSKRIETDIEIEQKLLCSNQSSTDYDLTGQIVWPAANMLCYFIAKHHNMFHNSCVIELGAGAGLAGFFCTNFAKYVIITDGNDVVMRLLHKNHASSEVTNGLCSVKKLLWGKKQYVHECLKDEQYIPEIIIGADVILWPTYTKTFLITLKYLLLMSKDLTKAVAYISYIVRAHTTTSLLYTTAEMFGLEINEIDVNDFLPNPIPKDLITLEKKLLVIRLKDPKNVDVNWIDDEDMDGRTAPC